LPHKDFEFFDDEQMSGASVGKFAALHNAREALATRR
jgi:hypothetical protein